MLFNRSMFRKKWSSDERLDEKTAIVTGANTGIGKETAWDLAKRGARVIMGCRNINEAIEAANEIIKDTGNTAVVACQLDLADTKSICDFTEEIYNMETPVHILINNAGVVMCPYEKTTDGFEMHIGVNHLGHFFLTFLMMDLLKSSAPARIINISSIVHKMGKIQFLDLNSEKSYHPVKAYAQSKLANVLFTQELAKRLEGTGVTVYAVDPGMVYTDAIRHMNTLIQKIIKKYSFLVRTPAEGAYTTIYCAITPGLEHGNGGYYSDCGPSTCCRAARDEESAKLLWKLSCNMLGIRWR
ncbi:retinol dehydrogenase 12 isoform X1 [Erpetoichthys calabaricus]|uniref:retinol dehydrogenase 12 isoform X1 n=2 Tax=Erpetoichthys calabaricus TaxID=27687 RepID=UPI002234BC95|nr:retinol dehydrogenase 12 isoform X1 [Erpetoichthys calabaricus]